MAEELNVPLVYTFQFSIAHIVERMCGQIPSPPSFVPAGMIKLTDKMSFKERIINMLFYLSQDAFAILVWKRMDNYYTEYFGELKQCSEFNTELVYTHENSVYSPHVVTNPYAVVFSMEHKWIILKDLLHTYKESLSIKLQ